MLLDRKRVKFWQKWVFGIMALLMASFLIFGYSGVMSSCTKSGGVLSATKELDNEISALQAKVKTNPADAASWTKLGEDYLLRGTQQKKDSSAQLSDWTKSAAAYKQAASVYAKQKGKQAVANEVAALRELVGVYQSLKDYQQAAGIYGRITELRPKSAQDYFGMASNAINAGDTNTAMLAFAKFLQLEPNDPQAAAIKQWMKQNAPKATPTPTSTKGGGT